MEFETTDEKELVIELLNGWLMFSKESDQPLATEQNLKYFTPQHIYICAKSQKHKLFYKWLPLAEQIENKAKALITCECENCTGDDCPQCANVRKFCVSCGVYTRYKSCFTCEDCSSDDYDAFMEWRNNTNIDDWQKAPIRVLDEICHSAKLRVSLARNRISFHSA